MSDREQIDKIRREIDDIDLAILELLVQRGECAIRIGDHKRRIGLATHDPDREQVIMRRLEEFSVGRFDASGVKRVYEEITRMMRAMQQSTAGLVTDLFARTVPSYTEMREAVFHVGRRFVQPATNVVDLGCGRGDGLLPFVFHLGDAGRCVGVDASQPLVDEARARFSEEVSEGTVQLEHLDLRTAYPSAPASVTLAVLSLQFLPVEFRQEVIAKAYTNTVPGGVIILVERVQGATAPIDELMAALYKDAMAEHGFLAHESERKKRMLEGTLVPLTAEWNEELLAGAGFGEVDCFWRWMNFAGWVGRKRSE